MSPIEAAKLVGCTPQQIRTLIRQGRIDASRIEAGGSQYEYDVDRDSVVNYKKSPQTVGFTRGRKRK